MRRSLLLPLAIPIAIAVTPNAHASSMCEAAYALAADAKHRDAIQALTECLQSRTIDTNDRARYLQGRAWSHYSLGALDVALADQEQAFALAAPTQRLEFINYAVMLRDAKRFSASLRAIEQAEAIDQKAGSLTMMTQYHKGWTLQEAGRHAEALAAFSKGLPAQPDYPFAYLKRAASLDALGRRSEARIDAEKFSALYTEAWRKHSSAEARSQYRAALKAYGISPSW